MHYFLGSQFFDIENQVDPKAKPKFI